MPRILSQWTIGLVFTLLLATACGFHKDKHPLTSGVGGPPATPAEKATFHWIKTNIVEQSCIGCHRVGSSSKAANFPFSEDGHQANYDDVMNSGGILDNDPTDADIYNSIYAKKMPPGSPLPADQMQAVADWIKKGAPKD